MISNFRGSKSLWIYLAFFASPLTAWAQEPQVAKLYNQGVDAYFGGRTCQAEALLSEAIQWNSQDPRAYYFRAFSLLRQGHVAEARGDMLVGAMLEAQSPHRYAVGSALERIQGSDRLMLERFRRNARRNVVLQTSATEQLPPHARTPRPQTFNKSESSVLRENRIVPLEELLRPGGPRSIVEEPTSTSPPIPPQNSSPAAQPAEEPATKTAAPPAPGRTNPFEDDAQKAPEKSNKPAAMPPQTTPLPVVPATPPAQPGENPFG